MTDFKNITNLYNRNELPAYQYKKVTYIVTRRGAKKLNHIVSNIPSTSSPSILVSDIVSF